MNQNTTDSRPFITHMLLATAWVRYNSPTGKATERQVSRVMQRQPADTLRVMLEKRNALPVECR